MGKELDVFLSAYSRETRENVLCLRTVVLAILRGADEQINPKLGLITYTLRGNGTWTCAIAPHMKHVNLLFRRGAEFADPAGLLAGTGKEVRHVRLKSEEETQNPPLHALLREAARLG